MSANTFPRKYFWYSPLIVSLLLCLVCEAGTAIDTGIYLNQALDLYNGQGVTNISRPFFTLLLTTFFYIFGPTVWAGTILIRIFFVADTFLIFFFAKRLFDIKVAFVSTSLLLSSWLLKWTSNRILLDNVYPFFVLCGLFCFLHFLDTRKITSSIFSGLLLGLGCFVKITSCLHLAVPMMVMLSTSKWYKDKNLIKGSIYFYVTAFLIVSLISIISALATGKNFDYVLMNYAYSHLNRSSATISHSHSIIQILSSLWQGFVIFWEKYIIRETSLGYLIFFSWIVVAIKAFSQKNIRFVFFIGLAFVPGMIHLGTIFLRPAQAAVFIFTSFIVLGVTFVYLVDSAFTFLAKKPKLKLFTKPQCLNFFIIIITFLLIFQQLTWNNRATLNLLTKSTLIGRLVSGKDISWKITGKFNLSTQKASN